MFIEGIIDKGILEALNLAGFEVMWVADTPRKAKSKGYDHMTREDFETEVIIRIYLDEDIENIILPEKVVDCVRTKDLPLLIGNPNPSIVEAVKDRLKEKKGHIPKRPYKMW